MKITNRAIVPLIFFLVVTTTSMAGNLVDTFETVESLNLSQKGYRLGAALDDRQKNTAQKNIIQSTTPGTYKFNDNGLMVVADRKTDRVLVIYEHFEHVTQKKVQDLTGMLFMDYLEPTVSAHDKVVYWAFGKHGKFPASEFEKSKETGKKLEIIATVKLNSDIKIMEKTGDDTTGAVYYIISSDPLLKFYQ